MAQVRYLSDRSTVDGRDGAGQAAGIAGTRSPQQRRDQGATAVAGSDLRGTDTCRSKSIACAGLYRRGRTQRQDGKRDGIGGRDGYLQPESAAAETWQATWSELAQSSADAARRAGYRGHDVGEA